MKKIILVSILYFICFTFLVSCQTSQVVETKPVEAPVAQKKIVLAWGESRQEWTDHLIAEIDKAKWNPAIENYCKTVSLKECVAQAVSIMAKYESGFKPETKYNETGHLQGVVSRGLFQISFDSSNMSAYKCGTKNPQQLHEPLFNISCMVKIVNYWLNRDLVFFGGDKLGLGRYHHVGRASSKSNLKIKEYLSGF